MDSRIRDLLDHGDFLFQQRGPLDTLNQEIAENFYPERADFTTTYYLGKDFAAHLDTSGPVLARRELANSFATMLRPREKPWFHPRPKDVRRGETVSARRWLEYAERVQRKAMYDRLAHFVSAAAQADDDYAAFGSPVISVELSKTGARLLYRTWHLRDVVWVDDAEGEIGHIQRRWKPTNRDLIQIFKDKVSAKVRKQAAKKPFDRVDVRHIVVSREDYEPAVGKRAPNQPWVSIFVETDTGQILEEVPSRSRIYVIPRWRPLPGSQYAYSPAVTAALADARLLQSISATLMQVSERAADPPTIAVQNMIKSPIDMLPGGTTWVDSDYDERLGEVLRPVTQDIRGINYGMELRNDTRAMVAQAFYLDRLNLPPMGTEMTAYETSQRVQEYIRRAIPLFEPMEIEYNGGICDASFDLLNEGGAFGSIDDRPPELRAADMEFHFESPLHDLIDQAKGQLFVQSGGLIAEAAKLDPAAAEIADAKVALRDALLGIGAPAKWLRTDDEAAEIAQQKQAQALAAAQIEAAAKGAATIKDTSEAAKNFADILE